MGIWDNKKKKDEFEAPVEEVSLAANRPRVEAAAAPKAAATPARPEEDESIRYGIDRAIELMRLLPGDNIELVVRVVKTTLESTHVKIPAIIKDAQRKTGEIEARISVLKKEIADLETEISTRRSEIGVLETDHAETTSVKDRLILAEKLSDDKKPPDGKVGAPPPTPPRAAIPSPSSSHGPK